MPSLSQALLLEYLPSSHSAFQGHAAHTARWPAMLRPKGSWGACTPQGIIHSSTVLHGADLYTLWHSLHSSMPLSRRTAMHASGDSPYHSSAKHHILEACFFRMTPFRSMLLTLQSGLQR